MADLEPGVVLSPSTIAAMERLRTPPPPRSTMSEQHKATPEQWANFEQALEPIEIQPGVFVGDRNATIAACVLELRARVEALEGINPTSEGD